MLLNMASFWLCLGVFLCVWAVSSARFSFSFFKLQNKNRKSNKLRMKLRQMIKILYINKNIYSLDLEQGHSQAQKSRDSFQRE